MNTATDHADDETPQARLVRLLKDWETARELGSQDDQDMAAGRVLDTIKAGGFPRWHWVCQHLLAAITEPVVCPKCNGAGVIKLGQGFFVVQTTCPECRGAGHKEST